MSQNNTRFDISLQMDFVPLERRKTCYKNLMAAIGKRRKMLLLCRNTMSDHQIGVGITTQDYFDERGTDVDSVLSKCKYSETTNRGQVSRNNLLHIVIKYKSPLNWTIAC